MSGHRIGTKGSDLIHRKDAAAVLRSVALMGGCTFTLRAVAEGLDVTEEVQPALAEAKKRIEGA